MKKIIDETDRAREFLKSIPGMHLFSRYIDNKLAGDFACEIADKMKPRVTQVDNLDHCEELGKFYYFKWCDMFTIARYCQGYLIVFGDENEIS